MIISFSGAQSSGKTTLLNKMQTLYPEYAYVPEVTRLVKRLYGLSINEAGDDLTQLAIISQHLHNILLHRGKNHTVIMDRCSLDGVVYTQWLYDQGKVNLQTVMSANNVFRQTIELYDTIFYTNPRDVNIEDDGERSTDVKFREEIIELFDFYMKDFKHKIIVLNGTVEERLQQIKQHLQKNNINIK
jgi:nicotinamide riboside kinase